MTKTSLPLPTNETEAFDMFDAILMREGVMRDANGNWFQLRKLRDGEIPPGMHPFTDANSPDEEETTNDR
jgi:hypothetical protein